MYAYTNEKAGDPGIGSLDEWYYGIYLYRHGMERGDERGGERVHHAKNSVLEMGGVLTPA